MPPHERARKALMATRRLHLPDKEVLQVLKELWKVFDKKWELIEAENYRALIDAYFEFKQNEGQEKEETHDTKSEVSLRPAKRLNSQEAEDQASSAMCKSSEVLSENENEDAFTTIQQEVNKKDSSSSRGSNMPKKLLLQPNTCDRNLVFHFIGDITKDTEKVKISLVDEVGNEDLPKFNYVAENVIHEKAYVNISLARIADDHCCSGCSGDCLAKPLPCHCAHETGGEFAYTPQGLLKEEFLEACISARKEICEPHYVYCQDCPLERSKNEHGPAKCNGHLIRKFIKECWRKCGCSMLCGNRVVQRGITSKLQVFLTKDGKAWGLRTLTSLPKGTFVCEYAGEILTNTELYERNLQSGGSKRHTYPVTLDADWGSERVLKDEEALCLDATFYGNVARFINHRCFDGNLIDIPVEVETPDRHYYHLALFTTRDVRALEELTWDYGIDFDDHNHPVKAFRCRCGSAYCRDMKQRKGKKLMSNIEILD